jgi:hypothetical protein
VTLSGVAGWDLVVADFNRRFARLVAGLPLTVSSGWRTRQENRRVGGGARSQHLIGTARDIVASRRVYAELARRAPLVGLRVVFGEPGHLDHMHVQRFPPGVVAADIYDAVARG